MAAMTPTGDRLMKADGRWAFCEQEAADRDGTFCQKNEDFMELFMGL
jgi:hypothetical protein